VQDSQTKDLYSSLLHNIRVVPLGCGSKKAIDKKKAREILSLSQDVLVLLLFGVSHSGKDNECVFKAVSELDNVQLVCAGASYLSIGQSPTMLTKKYKCNVKVVDRFISENEKSLFFGAADWTVLSYTKSFASTSSMLQESCAYSVPVISSNANVLGRLVKENSLGVLFEAEDSESLKNAILEAKEPEKYIKNCTEFVEENSFIKWSNRIKELYAEH
jgi:glycosyltransferase involved in cell wall biosynthesis